MNTADIEFIGVIFLRSWMIAMGIYFVGKSLPDTWRIWFGAMIFIVGILGVTFI